MKLLTTFTLILLTISQLSFAIDSNKLIDLKSAGTVVHNSVYKINLDRLSNDKYIYYDVICGINNYSRNTSLPISFYPEEGSVRYIEVNRQPAGKGKTHNSVNIPYGNSMLYMAGVNKVGNISLKLINSATDDDDIKVDYCFANLS